MTNYPVPGRLGDPDLHFRDDPRADPRAVAGMEFLGIAGEMPASPVDGDSPMEILLEFAAMAEEGSHAQRDALFGGLPPVEGVTSSIETIRGVDGNDIALYIHRPTGVDGPLPGVLHLHGGGMAIIEASSTGYVRWRDELAATGLVVVGVEFRNSGGKLGPHPFPAGLNDCYSGLQWMFDNKQRLGITKIVVSGESGGGTLSLATTLKAKQEGRIEMIDGVYAQCPAVANVFSNEAADFPSHAENDGYVVERRAITALLRLYDPKGENATNPLAWPLFADDADLRGLPPHVISVNELDPVRDEGIAYYRRLAHAGVSAMGRMMLGTPHAADTMFRSELSDVYLTTIRDIKGFADSL